MINSATFSVTAAARTRSFLLKVLPQPAQDIEAKKRSPPAEDDALSLSSPAVPLLVLCPAFQQGQVMWVPCKPAAAPGTTCVRFLTLCLACQQVRLGSMQDTMLQHQAQHVFVFVLSALHVSK